ncbi:hypothetical protein NQ318_008216 [Aromia moschata]|uniref:Uncharacterized protein n=1 Tax=Aromia moschata TaxID=1265417 RepID=A0AAV8YL49_9CUCU|nr:hypothetical protein NQ318_008216 [Aromia moschata]
MKEGARSPRSEEKKDLFDKLVEQANVNKLISFRVTDDNKLKIERRNSPLMNRDRGRERNEPGPGHSRSAFHPAHDRPSGKGGEEERRPHASERRARPYGSDQSPYASTRQRTTRERQHGDYSREGDRYHSEEFRRREALHGSHSSRHHSDYVRGRETRAGHISSAPHLSGSVRLHSLRSSNVADSSNKRSTSHLTHSSSASGATVRQSSGPYAKRNTKMSPEKQDALLNSLKDKVLDKPSSKDRRKGNDEGEYSWIERMNQCIDKDLLTPSNASTPQFIPSVPSPRNDYK